jgi:heme a synthase
VSAAAFAALVYVQLGLGALVAGLRAGLVDTDWPLMGGAIVPGEAFASPRAPFDDAVTAQLDHRMVAYAVLAFALVQAAAALRSAPRPLARRAGLIAAAAVLQTTLGIATLVLVVPIGLALAHQAMALALFGLAVWHWKATRMEQPPSLA